MNQSQENSSHQQDVVSTKYVEHKNSVDTDSVWHYFLREETGVHAKCKIPDCKKIINTGGGSTSRLHCHLKCIHHIVLKKKPVQDSLDTDDNKEPPTKKLLKISDFFVKSDPKSLEFVLARLIALDGLPFSVFQTSLDLRESLKHGIADKVLYRVEQRRTDFSGVLQYLHKGTWNNDSDDEDELFSIPPPNKIVSIIKRLLERFVPSDVNQLTEEPASIEDATPKRQKKPKMELQQELNQLIKSALNSTHIEKIQPTKALMTTIKKEMRLFEDGGSRGYHLQKVYDFLKTILPTSVESERAFSASGYLCNKIWCNLKDDTLNELCFLRSHFRSKLDQSTS